MPEFDAKTAVTTGFTLQSAPKTVTMSHTSGNEPDLAALVTVAWNDTLRTSPSGLWILDIRYNGTSMTFLSEASTSGMVIDTFMIIGQSAGSGSIDIDFDTADASHPYSMTIDYSAVASSWAAAEQTYFVEQSTTATGSTSPITASLTGTTEQHRFLDHVAAWSASGTPPTLTAAAGQTDIYNATNGGGTMNWRSASSYKLSHPTSQSLSWTESSNKAWATVLLELAPTPIIAFAQSQLSQTGAGLG